MVFVILSKNKIIKSFEDKDKALNFAIDKYSRGDKSCSIKVMSMNQYKRMLLKQKES